MFVFHISNTGVKHVLQRKYLASQSPSLDSFCKQNHNFSSYMFNTIDHLHAKTIYVILNRRNFEFHYIFLPSKLQTININSLSQWLIKLWNSFSHLFLPLFLLVYWWSVLLSMRYVRSVEGGEPQFANRKCFISSDP